MKNFETGIGKFLFRQSPESVRDVVRTEAEKKAAGKENLINMLWKHPRIQELRENGDVRTFEQALIATKKELESHPKYGQKFKDMTPNYFIESYLDLGGTWKTVIRVSKEKSRAQRLKAISQSEAVSPEDGYGYSRVTKKGKPQSLEGMHAVRTEKGKGLFTRDLTLEKKEGGKIEVKEVARRIDPDRAIEAFKNSGYPVGPKDGFEVGELDDEGYFVLTQVFPDYKRGKMENKIIKHTLRIPPQNLAKGGIDYAAIAYIDNDQGIDIAQAKKEQKERYARLGKAKKIDLTWVNELKGIGKIGGEKYAEIDGADYGLGDSFIYMGEALTVKDISPSDGQVSLQSVDGGKYKIGFRKKKGRKNKKSYV